MSEAQLPAAEVLGVGAVTALGRDMAAIAQRLAERVEGGESVRRVKEEWLADATVSRRLRRADRFVRMAVLAALDAWAAAQRDHGEIGGERVGLIVATGLGPHGRTFRFLDGILDCGDSSALPTDFSHSVHNAAAAYITEILGVRGRSCTVTDFEMGFEQAVALAQCWLAEGACTRVLVGAVEELGAVLERMVPRMAGARIVPGEGAVFYVLGPVGSGGEVRVDATSPEAAGEVVIVEEPAVLAAGVGANALMQGQRMVTFAPQFGHLATGSAFGMLGAVLSMRAGAVDSARTMKRIWNGAAATLRLERVGR